MPESSRTIAAFYVRGLPRPQPRGAPVAYKVQTAQGTKWRARIHDKGTSEAWKGDVIRAALPHRPPGALSGPIRLDLLVFLPRPKSRNRTRDSSGPLWHVGRPDRDNLDKAVLDALTADGWWREDSVVSIGMVAKFYHARDGCPGAGIIISSLPEAPPFDDSHLEESRPDLFLSTVIAGVY